MKKITVFSTDCPRCKVLCSKLEESGIQFEIEKENFDELIEHNLQTAPVLKYKNEYYQFGEAINLIQSGELTNEN